MARPDITEIETDAVLGVMKTNVLSLGPKLREFEKKLANFIGVRYAVGVNSGTSALHLIIRALGIKEGDEVITTPFSFIASANCILFERAKPVFVDIDKKSFNIDPQKIEEKITKRTKAILAVDIFGRPADWDYLKEIAKKHGLLLIEDSAEALGSEYKNKKCGSFGDAAVLAFYPNKQITTGEGGAVLTNSKKVADLCRSMSNQGRKVKNGKWLDHERLGFNYRISEINCALGTAQFSRVKEIIAKRKRVTEVYNKKLRAISDIEIPFDDGESNTCTFTYVIKLKDTFSPSNKYEIIKQMAKRGIQCGEYFQAIHLQPFYRKTMGFRVGDFPVTESTSQRTIALPFYNNLTEEEIDFVIRNLKKIIGKVKR